VDYPEFVRALRETALEKHLLPQHTHGGVIREMMRIMSRYPESQKRTDWIPDWVEVLGPDDDTRIAEDVYFVGCAPYFDVIFDAFNLNMVATHVSALELLKQAGVTCAVLADEVCCGHDALWSGDDDLFSGLARLNAMALERVGARRVFVSCPEGFHTLSAKYGEFFGNREVEIVNTVAFLAKELTWPTPPVGLAKKKADAKEAAPGEQVTLHDPCRMGRFSELYDEPRALLGRLKGVGIKEMEFSRDSSPCCGSNLWINCDHLSKRLQSGLIGEAEKTGAGVLLTSCDKCRIHLACANMVMGEVKPRIETENILTFIHERR
jgi:Fe-S oxidoreductase